VLAPDTVVPDVHEAVAVEVGRIAAVGLPEVLPPPAVVANVHEPVAVEFPGMRVGVAVGVTVACSGTRTSAVAPTWGKTFDSVTLK
jgi:hypothetical protein